jgi:flagellin-like protein
MIEKKKAISPIIATVLMINISVAMGVIYVLWANGTLGAYVSRSLLYFGSLEENREEDLALERVWFLSTNKTLVTVRNIGVRDLNITTIYVNGQSFTQYNGTVSFPYRLLVGQRTAFEVNSPWSSGATYSISVATARGSQAKGDYVA